MPEKKPSSEAELLSQIDETSVPATPLALSDFLDEYGASGTELYHGILNEDYNSALQGFSGYRKYDQMRRSDTQVRATLLAMELPIRTTRWFVKPSENEDGEFAPADQEIADFIENNLFEQLEQTWDDTVRMILTMLPFGVAAFEKVYKYYDGKMILAKLGWRKPTTIFRWEMSNGEPGIQQLVPTPVVDPNSKNSGLSVLDIPAAKLIIFSNQREGDNYEGISVLRTAYKNWKMKNDLYYFDNLKHERTSVGLPCITLPQGATPKDKEAAEAIVRGVRSTDQSGIVLPFGYVFDFKSPAAQGQGSADIFTSINHHNREIAKNILAQFLELGNTESGSRALSEDQSDLFMYSLTAIAKMISETINRYLIPELVDLNFNNVKKYPKIAFDKLGDVDYQKLATSLGTLAEKGIISTDSDLEAHVRDLMSLPPRNQEEYEENKAEEKDRAEKEIEKLKTQSQVDNKVDNADAEVDKAKAHEHPSEDNAIFSEICQIYDNEAIIALQNEARTPEDLARLKKKGLTFNDFEDKAPRALTFAERRVNFTSISRALESFGDKLESSLEDVNKKMKADILRQVKTAVDTNDIAAVGLIKARYKGELSQSLTDVQKEMFEIGKKTAATEMGVPVPPTKTEIKGAMRVQNDIVVGRTMNDVDDAVKSAVSEGAAKSGGISNYKSAEAVGAASAVIDAKLTKTLSGLKTVATVGAVNMGRASIFERYPEKVYAMQYSAIMDLRTTMQCMSLDGRVVRPGSAEFVKYSPPQHYNCRSLWIEILEDDAFKPAVTGVPNSITSAPSIDDFRDPDKPIAILKNSPAVASIKKEIAERQEKLDVLVQADAYPNRQKQHADAIKKLKSSIKGQYTEAAKELMIDEMQKLGIQFKTK